jgi:hypothetical protein
MPVELAGLSLLGIATRVLACFAGMTIISRETKSDDRLPEKGRSRSAGT